MRYSLPLLLLVVSCAAPQVKRSARPPVEYSFAGLKGQHVQVEVIDRGRLFDGNAGVVAATKQAVEQQLSGHGVVVDEAPSPELRRLVLVLDPPATKEVYGPGSCVQVTGRLEATSQAYLPTQESVVTRCGGRSGTAGPADPVGAIFVLVGAAIGAADGSTVRTSNRELGEALSQALAEVLSQVDLRTRQ